MAYLFKLKTDDAYIIAERSDFASYNFATDVNDWDYEGEIELTDDGLKGFALMPDVIIKEVAQKGFCQIPAGNFRLTRQASGIPATP